jgi:hypothetical protein
MVIEDAAKVRTHSRHSFLSLTFYDISRYDSKDIYHINILLQFKIKFE